MANNEELKMEFLITLWNAIRIPLAIYGCAAFILGASLVLAVSSRDIAEPGAAIALILAIIASIGLAGSKITLEADDDQQSGGEKESK